MERGLLSQHVVGAAHPKGWEHVGAPRRGLCAVVSSSHEHLGATASDLGSVGECANERPLSELWCQDGKCATLHLRRGMCMV